ncbi:MAG TPA: aspartyl protease family protein [Pyrinomonadaceae bacterium]|nr:aspartyl protease family protein [Pyrinomonadaceae bacterium]
MKRKLRATLIVTIALFIVTTFVDGSPVPGTYASRLCLLPIQANKPVLARTSDAPITIPFELVTRHIMLKVKVNNSRPLSFVFDTGDKVGIVDADVAKELGLKLEGQVHVGGAGADTLPGSLVKKANWTLPGLEGFSQPVVLSLPLGRMAARFGHDFDGIIGSDFIRQFVVEVDYQNRVLKLFDKEKFSYSGSGESIPIQLNSQGFPLLNGEVTPMSGDPIRGRFVLDLGSSGSLTLMSPLVTEHNLLGKGLKTIKALGVGGAGGQSNGQIGRVRSLQIGSFKIANPLTLFSEDKSGAMATRDLIANVGEQIAAKFKVFLDYSHARIILEPNSTFAEPMDRATAGLVMTTEGKDRAIVRIIDVLENSPASEAGLQKDDILMSIDGKEAADLQISRLAEMFEKPATYKLMIRRGAQSLHIPLTPRKLI